MVMVVMVCATINGMTIKIDKAGRVFLPKPVRDRLGLHEGSDLEMQDPGRIGAQTRRFGAVDGKEDGLWIHTGKVPPRFDAVQAVRDDREDRIRKQSGL